jgi:CheY-like chemotaxis protein
MPKVDGIEVLRHVKSDPLLRSIPVVVLTSSREDRDLVRTYVAILSADALPAQSRRLKASGAVAYLTKPIDISQVIQTIDDSLSTARPRVGKSS